MFMKSPPGRCYVFGKFSPAKLLSHSNFISHLMGAVLAEKYALITLKNTADIAIGIKTGGQS